MKQVDFSELAKAYIHRPAYSPLILNALLRQAPPSGGRIADVGAGTGKLTKELAFTQSPISAVEPNDAMRQEGIAYTQDFSNISWFKGSGEDTGLSTHSVNWVTMASSFHWTDPEKSLPEFHRILKQKGFLTLIWNPRNVQGSPLHSEIEAMIKRKVPGLKRVSSGSQDVKDWSQVLVSTGHFQDVIFMECDHHETMSQERYLGAWNSVNDIRAQAGESCWAEIMLAISQLVQPYQEITVPYKMRAWTAQKID